MTSALYALSVPLGVVVSAILRAEIQFGSNALAFIHSPLQGILGTTGQTPSLVAVTGTSGNQSAGQFTVLTNASQQIRAVGSTNGIALLVTTYGWLDHRGKDN
jgi:hypothetical protein